jgi:putative solute:sodium symporter small subunit
MVSSLPMVRGERMDRRAYGWRVRRLAVPALILGMAVVVGIPLLVSAVDHGMRAAAATGFVITIEAALPLLVVLTFWYCAVRNRVEQRLDARNDDRTTMGEA